MIDDTLLLAWDKKKGYAKGVDRAALSPSSLKTFAEDPQLWYLDKVAGHKRPFSMPLVIGIAVHEGMEVFLGSSKTGDERLEEAIIAGEDKVHDVWGKLPRDKRCVRVNPDDPANPRNKQEIPVTVQEIAEDVGDLLYQALLAIRSGDHPMLRAQQGDVRVEASIGELAEERGLPYTTITSYDPHKEEYGPMKAAVVAGVPVRGRIDAVATMPDGEEIIIDHKAVSKIVSYYPPYHGGGEWTSYDPSYNVDDSIQLDVYSYATGIPRAGFQFLLRRPQYIPESGKLWKDWHVGDDWQGSGFPAVESGKEYGLDLFGVYRPIQADADRIGNSTSNVFTLNRIEERVTEKLRQVAQAMTESLILYEDGVDARIAFPAGDPEEIARKACPFCDLHQHCAAPREPTDQSTKEYNQDLQDFRSACEDHDEIQELRAYWEDKYGTQSLFA